jgi:hypothetical protein
MSILACICVRSATKHLNNRMRCDELQDSVNAPFDLLHRMYKISLPKVYPVPRVRGEGLGWVTGWGYSTAPPRYSQKPKGLLAPVVKDHSTFNTPPA